MTRVEQLVGTDGNGPSEGSGYEPMSNVVAAWIRNRIIEGELKPGERIRQDAVAKACGTSRIPVREALNRLRNEGLVTLVAHVGARVARLDIQEVDEIYALRELIEPWVLAESVPHLTADDHHRLNELIDDMERVAGDADPSTWLERDRLFHLTSYSAAPLPRALALIEGFWDRSQQYRRAYTLLPDRIALAAAEHRLILNTIEQYDAQNAEALSRVHIRRTRLFLDEHSELFDDEPAPKPRRNNSRARRGPAPETAAGPPGR
jgi:DNA-binding GntR family transcriptional regulator